MLALLIAVLGAIPDAEPVPQVAVHFRIQPVGQVAGASGPVTLRPVVGDGKPLTVVVDEHKAVAQLPAGSSWQLEPAFVGGWAPQEILTVPQGVSMTSHAVKVWPSGRMHGALAMADPREKMPEVIDMQIVSLPGTRNDERLPERTVVRCSVKDARFACIGPAIAADIVVRGDGFIPHYRWGIRIGSDASTDLGKITLRRGASLVGWARAEEGKIDPATARARLRRVIAAATGGPNAERLQRPVAETPVRADGFFQLAGIEPGTYMIEVEQPQLAAARVFPIDVFRDAETKFQGILVLKKPLTVSLVVEPARDWTDSPWHITVFRAGDFSMRYDRAPVFDGTTDDGKVAMPGQAAGMFRFTVSDSLQNPLAADTFEVTSAADATHTVSVDLLRVHGALRYGSEPLQADLVFGGAFGARHVETHADADGTFATVLPSSGRWAVDVSSGSPPIKTTVAVTIEADKDHTAKVDIVVPENSVDGVVLDEDAKPVANADVSLASAGSHVSTRSSADGRFHFRGTPAAKSQLHASAFLANRSHTTAVVDLAVEDDSHLGPIELRLQRQTEMSATVVSPRGPVPGARVLMIGRAGLQSPIDSTVTGLDGVATFHPPADTTSAVFIVSPPGHALRVFERVLDGQPLTFDVYQNGGRLEIDIPPMDREKPLIPAIVANGMRFLVFTELYQWAAGHGVQNMAAVGAAGGTFVAPDVAPGEYRLCFGPPTLTSTANVDPWLGAASCATGVLAPGGTLRLAVSPAVP
ncbi:MAG: carboxypeptidase regulatory-like domain-containing protein [Acidobacteria bacterium]|nr:carboxypeptidase regulatory-like domain-containing protein [Acidobacteriota bacterium]